MAKINIPESVLSYSNQQSVRTAVDHLLAAKVRDFPPDLHEPDEVRSYHKAILSAYQVRVEHALVLMDLWESIWGPALKRAGINRRFFPSTKKQNWSHAHPSPGVIWDDAYYRLFIDESDKGAVIDPSISWHAEEGIQLYIAHWDSDGDSTGKVDFLLLPEPWREETDDGFRGTKPGFAMPSLGEFSFDISNLAEAAEVAIEAMTGGPKNRKRTRK